MIFTIKLFEETESGQAEFVLDIASANLRLWRNSVFDEPIDIAKLYRENREKSVELVAATALKVAASNSSKGST